MYTVSVDVLSCFNGQLSGQWEQNIFKKNSTMKIRRTTITALSKNPGK